GRSRRAPPSQALRGEGTSPSRSRREFRPGVKPPKKSVLRNAAALEFPSAGTFYHLGSAADLFDIVAVFERDGFSLKFNARENQYGLCGRIFGHGNDLDGFGCCD